MKKNILLTLTALFCAICAQAISYDVKIGDLYYDLYPSSTGNTATVTSSPSSEEYRGDIVIPSSVTYEGATYSVTRMGNYIFADCTGLTTVQIPGSIEIIAKSAFQNCTNLITVTIGDGVKTIAGGWESKYNQIYYYGAFMGCTKLQSINIPNSVTEIGAYAFEDCIGLTSVTIPNSVTTLGIYAFRRCSGITALHIGNGITTIESGTFYGCTGLTSLNIPNSVTEINGHWYYSGAFAGCTGLTTITIPNSVTNIGYDAFGGCSGLSSITIPNSVISLGDGAFAGCTNLTSVTIGNGVTIFESELSDGGKGTFGDCTSLTSIVIPDNVKNINNGAFQGCINLKSVTLPSSLTDISAYLFKGCTNLPSVTIPNGVTEIGSCAFYNCASLTSIVIPNNVTEIDNSAFYGCTNLKSIVLPNGVTTIGYDAFEGCKNLTSIVFPENLKSIKTGTFKECTGLTSITIPNSVTEIGGCNRYSDHDGAFYGCSRLSSITIGSGITKIGNFAFDGCTNLIKVDYKGDIKSWLDIDFGDSYSRDATNPIYYSHNLYINGKLLTNLDIPQGVTTISDAFKGDTCITSITMPNSVTKIETSAFDGCKGITSVSLSPNITSIGRLAFDDCDKLAMITIPNKVTQIGGGALHKCQNVVMLGTTPPVVSNSTFSSGAMIRVPCEAVDSYLSASSWSSYSDQINGLSYNVILSATEGGSAKITSSDCSSNMMTIEATPASAYKFVRWSDGNTDNPRTMTVTSDINLTAEFTAQTYTISVTCDPQQGTVTGGGEYTYNADITIEAIPNAGYEFKQWSNGLTYNPYRFTVVSDLTLEAQFIPATAIDNTTADTDTTPQKVLIDGQVYILRNGKTYTLTGVEVK